MDRDSFIAHWAQQVLELFREERLKKNNSQTPRLVLILATYQEYSK